MGHHRHKASRSEDWGFGGCAAPYDCDPRAHGGVTIREVCACGATRERNVNQRWSEHGVWSDRSTDICAGDRVTR